MLNTYISGFCRTRMFNGIKLNPGIVINSYDFFFTTIGRAIIYNNYLQIFPSLILHAANAI